MLYGSKALDVFFEKHGLNRVLRGHQAKSSGVGISNGARVLTVFSDSKDHFDHDEAQCGCLLVEDEIKVIIGRPAPDVPVAKPGANQTGAKNVKSPATLPKAAPKEPLKRKRELLERVEEERVGAGGAL